MFMRHRYTLLSLVLHRQLSMKQQTSWENNLLRTLKFPDYLIKISCMQKNININMTILENNCTISTQCIFLNTHKNDCTLITYILEQNFLHFFVPSKYLYLLRLRHFSSWINCFFLLLRFFSEHPRRGSTLLFPSRAVRMKGIGEPVPVSPQLGCVVL